jgi:hypothetical protein
MSTAVASTSLKFAFDRVTSEYAELSDLWKQIDAKAQSTVAVAGIFIAAAFAFINNAAFKPATPEKILLSLVLGALVATVLLAIFAMLVRSVPTPPEPEDLARMTQEILARPPEEHDQRHAALMADTINAWLPVNRTLRTGVAAKAGLLTWSQRALLAAAVLTVCLTILAIWGRGGSA